MTLSESERRRLTAILGMLGSNSAGERDNAARMAEQFRRQHRLTWDELLGLPPAPPKATVEPIKRASPEPKTAPHPAPPRAWHKPLTPFERALAYAHPAHVACVIGFLILVCYGLVHD